MTKLSKYVLIILVTVGLLITVSWSAQKTSVDHWEYKIISKVDETTLNQLGAQGWELVAVDQDINSGTTTGRYYLLKRSKR